MEKAGNSIYEGNIVPENNSMVISGCISDFFSKVTSYLDTKSLIAFSSTCHGGKYLFLEENKIRIGSIKEIAFGKKEWKQFIDPNFNIDELALPKDIAEKLYSLSQINSNKMVKDTHVLVLMPEGLDLKYLLSKVNFSVKSFFIKSNITFPLIDDLDFPGNIFEPLISESYWALVSKDVLSDDVMSSYGSRIIVDLVKKDKANYKLPAVIEVLTAVFAHHFKTGEYLLGENPFLSLR